MRGQPPIEPPDNEWCNVCGEPVMKKWTGERYLKVCACQGDEYWDDFD